MKKLFKLALCTIIAATILGALWDIPLVAITLKIVISAALIAWLGKKIMAFKNDE